MKKIIFHISYLIFLISSVFAQEFDFTQERNTIPVSFDGVECQVPWTTGYNYINPTFCDIDGDDDFDLFIGSDWSRISFFINNGDQNNHGYEFASDELVNLPDSLLGSQQTNRPALCDIDNDGDYDLFIGLYLGYPVNYGRLYFYRNVGDSINFQFVLEDEFYQGIDYHNEQYPFFVDIDNDGDYDLFIGLGHHWNPTDGRIAYYENIGTSEEAIMDSVTSFFLGIDLGDECIPCFIDIDADNDYDMFLGDEEGNIHFYRNEGTPEVYDFVLISDNYFNIDVGFIASPTFCDIDDDGDFDLFIGERSWGEDNNHGDIWFYENLGTAEIADFQLITQNFLTIDIGVHACPEFTDIDNDGLTDMFFGDSDGNINYFSNIGTETEPAFSFTENAFQNIWATYQSRPTFGDLDDDGDLDLIVSKAGFSGCKLYLYSNNGTPENPSMELVSGDLIGTYWVTLFPRLIDINNDSDLDLFVGHDSNQVMFWENQGTPLSPQFVLVDENYLNTPLLPFDDFTICFGDIDNDDDFDLIRGHSDGTLSFYRNTGTSEIPNFVLEEDNFLGIDMIISSEPYLEDIDNDGDLDLFVGSFCGGVSFWRNNEVNSVNGEPKTVNRSFALMSNYPNPFNNSTTLKFHIPQSGEISLKIYNIYGQEVVTLVNGSHPAGEYRMEWDASAISSGIYFAKLSAKDFTKSVKLLLNK